MKDKISITPFYKVVDSVCQLYGSGIKCKFTKKCHCGAILEPEISWIMLYNIRLQSALVTVGIETVVWSDYDMVEQTNIHQFTSRLYLLCKAVVLSAWSWIA